MSAALAIGVGCRRDCPAEVIVALLTDARERVGRQRPARLFTLDAKLGEPGLRAAAAALDLDLLGLPPDQLAAVMARVQTRSVIAQNVLGLASVSEAAALAGAGPGARLILPRIAAGGATCAVALGEDA